MPEPERKKHHPLVEAAMATVRFPFKVLVEWPMDAINRVEQRLADKRNREMYEKAERDQRIRRMFPPEEKKKSHPEG